MARRRISLVGEVWLYPFSVNNRAGVARVERYFALLRCMTTRPRYLGPPVARLPGFRHPVVTCRFANHHPHFHICIPTRCLSWRMLFAHGRSPTALADYSKVWRYLCTHRIYRRSANSLPLIGLDIACQATPQCWPSRHHMKCCLNQTPSP
jgi:hypothetical protein